MNVVINGEKWIKAPTDEKGNVYEPCGPCSKPSDAGEDKPDSSKLSKIDLDRVMSLSIAILKKNGKAPKNFETALQQAASAAAVVDAIEILGKDAFLEKP